MTPIEALLELHTQLGSHSHGDESQADHERRYDEFSSAAFNAIPDLRAKMAELTEWRKYIASIGGMETAAECIGHADDCLAVIGPNISVSPECTCGLSALRSRLSEK